MIPLLSIGLPVYNGEKYIEYSLNSILSQTFTDFELIIADNASTDRTKLICSKYAERDNRIRYHRNKKNMGAAWNHNYVFKLSNGRYFKWVSCDDILSPKYLENCVKILDSHPNVVLCHSMTGRINEKGQLKGIYPDIKISKKTSEHFADIISMRNYACYLLLGVIRKNAIEKTRLMGTYIGADRNLLAEISLLGSFHQLSELLFFKRAHYEAYTYRENFDNKEKLKWWSNTSSGLIFPYCRIMTEYFNSVKRSPLDWRERQLCNIQILKWFFNEGWLLIGNDFGTNILHHQRSLFKLFVPYGRALLELAQIK